MKLEDFKKCAEGDCFTCKYGGEAIIKKCKESAELLMHVEYGDGESFTQPISEFFDCDKLVDELIYEGKNIENWTL